jgi:hypothetical protein
MTSRASVTTILTSVETSERAARTFCSNAAPRKPGMNWRSWARRSAVVSGATAVPNGQPRPKVARAGETKSPEP